MIESTSALVALIAGLVAVSFWLEAHTAWGRRVGSSMLIILGGAVFSNLELVPLSSPVYGAITGPVTSLAIVWLLFAVDLRDLKQAGPRMLLAFALAVLGTIAGAVVASLTIGRSFPDEAWRLAGVMTGTYAGGSLNFAAVGREVGLGGSLWVAATAADNVLTAVWVGATLMLPVWLAGVYRRRARSSEPVARREEGSGEHRVGVFAGARLDPTSVMALTALGFVLILAADALAARLPGVPGVLWLTTLALLLGQLPWVRKLEGSLHLGLIALNLFFAVIGIGSKVSEILGEGLGIFWFTLIVVAVHGVFVYAAAWLLRLDVESTSVASQAAVGGPSTAIALAIARGWRHLTVPGMVVGLLGYAVGNYAGLAVAALVRDYFGL